VSYWVTRVESPLRGVKDESEVGVVCLNGQKGRLFLWKRSGL